MALVVRAVAVDTLDADALDTVQKRGELIWGADSEGGGPYVFSDPADPRRVTGFEVDLADALARQLGVKSRFSQGPWNNLPALLNTGAVDIVLNGYELTARGPAEWQALTPIIFTS